MRIGVKPGQWGWTFDELRGAWRAAEDAGFGLLSCFDHVTAAPSGNAAWDAPSLLTAMAGETHRIPLSVHVLNVSLRNPLLLAGQIAVAQAASGGRVEVGLGAGSFHLARHDHRAAGIAFPPHRERLRALEACVELFPRLWRGETVDDETLGLDHASLGPIGIRPPRIVVGGTSEDAISIAVRHADGWNANADDLHELERSLAAVDDAVRRERRERALERQVQLFLREHGLDGIGDRLRALGGLGVDTAVVVLDTERGPEWVRRLADAVLPAPKGP